MKNCRYKKLLQMSTIFGRWKESKRQSGLFLRMKAALFDSMIKHITEYPNLKEMLYAMLLKGEQIVYSQDNHTIELACMFGYIQDDGISVKVANRIFETRLYNLFCRRKNSQMRYVGRRKENKSQFVYDGRLNMERILEKFVEHFNDIYGENNNKFVEDYGRKVFSVIYETNYYILIKI